MEKSPTTSSLSCQNRNLYNYRQTVPASVPGKNIRSKILSTPINPDAIEKQPKDLIVISLRFYTFSNRFDQGWSQQSQSSVQINLSTFCNSRKYFDNGRDCWWLDYQEYFLQFPCQSSHQQDLWWWRSISRGQTLEHINLLHRKVDKYLQIEIIYNLTSKRSALSQILD